jgi:ABC-type cobalamin/Fe3+-siderophores transport system ATPase subunit
MSNEFILETRELTREFKGFVAVDRVNIQVKRGSIHALIGPNGAGKTTVFNLLTKFLPVTSGQIFYKGQDITALRAAGIDAHGPLSGDTAFARHLAGEFDGLVALYHDQGLAPLKTIDFAEAANLTLGLPFIRTSPDHGTAYALAGTGKANPRSLASALRLAYHLSS